MFPLINFQAILQSARLRAEQDDVFSPVEHRTRRRFERGRAARVERAAQDAVARQMARVCTRDHPPPGFVAPGTNIADNRKFEVARIADGTMHGMAIVDNQEMYGFVLYYEDGGNVRIDLICTREHRLAYQHPQTLFRRLMRHVFEVAFGAGLGVVLDAAGATLVHTYSQPPYGGFRQVEDEEQIRLASPGCTPMFVAAGDVAERMANIAA